MRISKNLIKELVENFKTDLVFSNIKGKEYQVRMYLTEEEYKQWQEIHSVHTKETHTTT